MRTMGRTGLVVSEIGFGCGGNAGLMVHGTADEQRAAISTALELGINYFDTAPVYGDTASESNLGRALRSLGAKPIVATKIALEFDELDDIPAAVVDSVERSLERLGLERLELVHLHNRVGTRRAPKPNIGVGALLTVDDVLGPRGVVEGLRRLRTRGLVGSFGCCAFGGEMQAVRTLIDSGWFDNLLVHYSLLNRTAWNPASEHDGMNYEGIGEYAARRGLGTSVLRVFEGGALTGARHRLARESASPSYQRAVAKARALLEETNEHPVRYALRFALSNPDVSTVLIGFSEARQVEEAAAFAA
jgi:aryl-alcohol dehydrogenase-like predicted oxidoreductase